MFQLFICFTCVIILIDSQTHLNHRFDWITLNVCCCWTTIYRKMLNPTKRRYATSKGKEEDPANGRRSEITFRIKPHILQRCSEGSNKTLCATGGPTETEPDLPLSVWGLLQRYRSSTASHRWRSSGCSRPGYGISPFGGGHH